MCVLCNQRNREEHQPINKARERHGVRRSAWWQWGLFLLLASSSFPSSSFLEVLLLLLLGFRRGGGGLQRVWVSTPCACFFAVQPAATRGASFTKHGAAAPCE